jgi:YVTN family beta-propeller protein
MNRAHRPLLAAAAVLAALVAPRTGGAQTVGGPPPGPALLPTGQYITALAAPGSKFFPMHTGLRPDDNADANGAVTSVLSPDGKTLLVLTSGYNGYFYTTSGSPITTPYIDPATGLPADLSYQSNQFQWVYVYDVSGRQPRVVQKIQIPNAYDGLAWDPSGTRFYFSGGQDDRIYIYRQGSGGWVPDAPDPVLNHNPNDNQPEPSYVGGLLYYTPAGNSALVNALGLDFGAETAGVAVGQDGSQLFAANLQNDSISVVNLASRTAGDIQLYMPGANAKAIGEFPYWVTPHSPAPGAPTDKVYVTSARDGQVLSVAIPGPGFSVIPVGGGPGKMLLSPDESRLYVANPDADEIEVIDTVRDKEVAAVSMLRPGYRYRGSMPNSLALSPDGTRLYATLGGENAVIVIDVASLEVLGRIPTAWYPSSVTVSADGKTLYVLNTKHESGPTPTLKGYYTPPQYPNPTYLDQYVYNTEKAGLETIPVPSSSSLAYLSSIVDANNGFNAPTHDPMMEFLRHKIKHVIYIMKENRTYDQVLGDLPVGNGDPRLVEFPQAITPNFHELATQFSDLDNFYMGGDVSGDGWNWSQQGHANDYTNKSVPVDYAGGGFDFEWNGTTRYQNSELPVFAKNPTLTNERMTELADPTGASNIEPGPRDVADTVGADDETPGQTGGYIWDSVLRAGLSYRHYGLYADETFYTSDPTSQYDIPITRTPFKQHIVQGAPLRPAIAPYFDRYYRGWDLNVPDEWRFEEWQREFAGYVKNGDMPAFETVLFMMDHFGNFTTNVEGLSNPNVQIASNDHAVGELVDAVSHSPYWSSTAIFILEDDSQDGPDHVDSHRSPGFVISPWVRGGSVDSTVYSTPSMLRTMEDILGIDHLGMNDANAPPMSDVFTTHPNLQPYTVIIPGVLCQPPVHPDLVPQCNDPLARKTRPVRAQRGPSWWRDRAKRFVFTRPDSGDADAFNRLVWEGLRPGTPYPVARNGADLRAQRSALLGALRVDSD